MIILFNKNGIKSSKFFKVHVGTFSFPSNISSIHSLLAFFLALPHFQDHNADNQQIRSDGILPTHASHIGAMWLQHYLAQ